MPQLAGERQKKNTEPKQRGQRPKRQEPETRQNTASDSTRASLRTGRSGVPNAASALVQVQRGGHP